MFNTDVIYIIIGLVILALILLYIVYRLAIEEEQKEYDGW